MTLELGLELYTHELVEWFAIQLHYTIIRLQYQLQDVLEWPNVYQIEGKDQSIVEHGLHFADAQQFVMVFVLQRGAIIDRFRLFLLTGIQARIVIWLLRQ